MILSAISQVPYMERVSDNRAVSPLGFVIVRISEAEVGGSEFRALD